MGQDDDGTHAVPQKKLMLSRIIESQQHRNPAPAHQRRITLPDALDIVSVDDTSGSCVALPSAARRSHDHRASCEGGDGPARAPATQSAALHVEVSPMTAAPSSPPAGMATSAPAHERLSRLDTAASFAKRRMKSSSPKSSKQRTVSIVVDKTAMQHHADGDRADAINTCSSSIASASRDGDQQAQQRRQSTATVRRGLSTSNISGGGGGSRAAVGDMSPTVERLGIGTSQDTRKLALRSAELRKELRRLHDLNRKHQAQQERIEASHRTDDSLDVIHREAEAIGNVIEAESRRREGLIEALEGLRRKGDALERDSAGVRMARNSVQRVLFERREAFDAWKQVVAVEHQRRAEAKTHALLQRQLASASAGDRAVRPPSVVRQERDALRELVARLQAEYDRLGSACMELEEGTRETKQRAADLLEEDDRLDERIHALQEYISSAKKMLCSNADEC